MHDFIHEIERFMLVVWIILFGGSLMNGILILTDWKVIVFPFAFVMLIRQLAGLIALAGIRESFKTKLAISFLGIRCKGSIFYLSWAFVQSDAFSEKMELYSIASCIILISIVVHGLTAPSIVDYFRKEI